MIFRGGEISLAGVGVLESLIDQRFQKNEKLSVSPGVCKEHARRGCRGE
jgi:hypothetical protein